MSPAGGAVVFLTDTQVFGFVAVLALFTLLWETNGTAVGCVCVVQVSAGSAAAASVSHHTDGQQRSPDQHLPAGTPTFHTTKRHLVFYCAVSLTLASYCSFFFIIIIDLQLIFKYFISFSTTLQDHR